jgi:hypothetical protein
MLVGLPPDIYLMLGWFLGQPGVYQHNKIDGAGYEAMEKLGETSPRTCNRRPAGS